MAMVTEMVVYAPVKTFSGRDFGADAIRQTLYNRGWSATVNPLYEKRKLKVTLRRFGSPRTVPKPGSTITVPNFVAYDDIEGRQAVASAANAFGTILAALNEWVVESTKAAVETAKALTPSEIGKTAAQAYQEKLAVCQAQGGFLCSLQALGVPKWVAPVGIGVGALLVLGQLASIKRAFFGGVSVRRRRRR